MTDPVASDGDSKRRQVEFVKKRLLVIISRSEEKRTPLSLTRELRNRFSVPENTARGALRELICSGELGYTTHFGTSFVEKSYLRPVRVSNQIILKPPQLSFQTRKDMTVVDLFAGSAFGSGAHPTTRLAIRGIEFAARALAAGKPQADSRALDIGTGSGVLAIVSVKLGIGSAVAVDTDSCARVEARKNIALNRLENRIAVDHRLPKADRGFLLISANLRAPTVKQLYPYLIKSVVARGMIVVAGIREAETENLWKRYRTTLFRRVFTESELGWCCMVFEKQHV